MAIQSARRAFDTVSTAEFAHLFHAFSDPTRLAIVKHLCTGDHRVRDLVDHMQLAQSTVSKHIAHLLECDLVRARPEGRATWYSITQQSQLHEFFDAAAALYAATARPEQPCTHIRTNDR